MTFWGEIQLKEREEIRTITRTVNRRLRIDEAVALCGIF
jgi:hypothetical protein